MSFDDYARALPDAPEPPGRGTRRRAVVAVCAALAAGLALVLLLAASPASNHQPVVNAGSLRPAAPSVTLPRVSAPAPMSRAQAQASASAAAATFAPPTALPAGAVPSYAGSLTTFTIPADLTVSLPQVQAANDGYQQLADDVGFFLNAWAEAWAAGDPQDPRFDAWCVAACHTTADQVIDQWASRGLAPAGDLVFYGLDGGPLKSDAHAAEFAVCLDASDLTAVSLTGGGAQADPFPGDMSPSLFVFGLLYDKQAGRWVVTSGYWHAGDAYCTGGDASS